jgi:chromosome segregation ATPase
MKINENVCRELQDKIAELESELEDAISREEQTVEAYNNRGDMLDEYVTSIDRKDEIINDLRTDIDNLTQEIVNLRQIIKGEAQ